MHLHDVLDLEITDYVKERNRLEALFANEVFYSHSSRSIFKPSSTLKRYLTGAFLASKLRGTSLDIDDFISRCSPYWNHPTMEGLLFYCEMILNLLNCNDRYCPADANRIISRLRENISIILEKTGFQEYKTPDGLIAIVKKNALASSVIEDIDDKVAARAILEYNRLDMKGNLEGKRKLLKQIGDFIEPTLQKRKELPAPLNELADDVSFCLNNLNIRHNNKEGIHKKPFLETIPDNDLEVLYDDAYRTALLLIELSKQEESHNRIGAVRQQSKGTK